MNAEFKAYIHAVTDGSCGGSRAPFSLRKNIKKVFAFFADLLEAIGPYYCELRPMTRVRGAFAKCCPAKQAIGFHGLV